MQCADTKETNPKDAIGANKLPIGLVPSTGINLAAVAFLEGASKYGRYNWRIAGVKTSIYYDAVQRHLEKYWNGEEEDRETGVPHLASALACIMIIADAKACGQLNDDRPPMLDVNRQIMELEEIAHNVRALFADRDPHQWTIQDPTTDRIPEAATARFFPEKAVPEKAVPEKVMTWPSPFAINQQVGSIQPTRKGNQ